MGEVEMIRKFLEENSDLAVVITRDDGGFVFDPSFRIDIREVKTNGTIFSHVLPDYILNRDGGDLETELMTPVIKAWESRKAREMKRKETEEIDRRIDKAIAAEVLAFDGFKPPWRISRDEKGEKSDEY